MAGSRLHLTNGTTLDVDQLPEDAARMLWSTPQDDGARGAFDAHDMGFAALQKNGATLRINPAAVLYIEDRPEIRAADYRIEAL